MTIQIQERIEGKRGCGYRKPGGLYLVGPSAGHECCRLPFPLTACPTCGAGIKPSRGWTWVDADKLFFPLGYEIGEAKNGCYKCPLNHPGIIGRVGLLWIGERFYKTPQDFLQEAGTMGISRRISTVPRGFELGKTWVLLAHRKVILEQGEKEPIPKYRGSGNLKWKLFGPAIFSVFRPTAVEYVVRGDESEAELEQLTKRGLTPVRVRNKVPYE